MHICWWSWVSLDYLLVLLMTKMSSVCSATLVRSGTTGQLLHAVIFLTSLLCCSSHYQTLNNWFQMSCSCGIKLQTLGESTYVFFHFVYPNSVFVSVSGTHVSSGLWECCGQSLCRSQTKSVDVSIASTGWTLFPSGSWTPQETDVFRRHLVPVSSFKLLKKNKHLSRKAGDFSLQASMTSNWASGHHRPAKLTVTERGREIHPQIWNTQQLPLLNMT